MNNNLKSQKPSLSFWQIWNMSFGFLGIQFGFALQNANTSRIFETLGADVEDLAVYWLAAPVTGLVIQPIIGYFSDRTWNSKLGRRRPYFLVGAILASVALCLMPNSGVLWIAIGVLWIMDASINITMEPFRAFVGDNLSEKQRTLGFAMQSFFIGIGGVLGSAMPYILSEWIGLKDSSADSGAIPVTVRYSFYLGAFVFLLAVLWTVFRSKEYPPEELERYEEQKELSSNEKEQKNNVPIGSQRKTGLIMLVCGLVLTTAVVLLGLKKDLFILTVGIAIVGALFILASSLRIKQVENGFVDIMTDLLRMPATMRQLAWVQFFSWFAMFSMWIYATSAVTNHLYDMKVEKGEITKFIGLLDNHNVVDGNAEELNLLKETKKDLVKLDSINANKTAINLPVSIAKYFIDTKKRDIKMEAQTAETLNRVNDEYEKGGNWVALLMGVKFGVAALVAFLLPILVRKTSRKVAHLICLTIGGLGLISYFLVPHPDYLILSMIGIGIAWASILAIPYAMLTSALPSNKMGYYMGVFNFFIVIPQIVAASILGFLLTSFFQNQAIYALVVGGFSMIIAGFLTLGVNDYTAQKK